MWPFKDSDDKDVIRQETRIKALEKESDSLRDERNKLKDEVEDIKLEKKIEGEDIKHMVKMNEERTDLAKQKYELKMEGEKDKAIAKVKDNYRDKTEAYLKKRGDDMRSMHDEILKRLPNVNVKLTGEVGGR